MAFVGKVRIGETPMTAIPMAVGSSLCYTCSTEASVAEKTIVAPAGRDMNSLMDGITIHVLFINTNTAENPQLRVNDLVALPILRNIEEPVGVTPQTSWEAGSVVSLTYVSGVAGWIMNDSLNTDTTYDKVTAAADGLMSKEDKARFDANSVAIRNDCSAGYLEDTGTTGYPYKLAIVCNFGANYASGFVHVVFSQDQIAAMKPASIATISEDGNVVSVPIKKQMPGEVVVPTVICIRSSDVTTPA